MKYGKILVSLVFVFALVALIASSVSATISISKVEVDGVTGQTLQVIAGQTSSVRVFFNSDSNVSDARLSIWISGETSITSKKMELLPVSNGVYSALIPVDIPANIDPVVSKKLFVRVEADNGDNAEVSFDLSVQRESYKVDILDAIIDNNINAGSSVPVDVVLKNRGYEQATDTFVTVSIPALGIQKESFFGDLSPVDQSDPDMQDSVEGRMYLTIPSSAPAGIYVVEVRAYNADTDTTVTKKVAIGGASENSMVIPATTSKTFAVGEQGTYSLTLVNSGNSVRVYQLGFETASGLQVDADEPVVALSAGMSKTVKITASSDKAGTYSFAVNVQSDGQLVKKESYVANIQGGSAGIGSNATVILTVVLAIVFIVLLVVLVVLLTRKPMKSEEFGESYY